MLRFLIFFVCFLSAARCEDVYYKPEQWRDHVSENYFEIVFIGHDKNGDYLILVNNLDMDVPRQQYYTFFEIRCIKPETAFKNWRFTIKNHIGEKDSDCDCKKFKFYEIRYDGKKYYNEAKEKGACFGYKEYSLKEFQELAPLMKQPPELDYE